MIRVGKRGIRGVFLGDIPIKEIYLGTTLLYSSTTENSRLIVNKTLKNK